MSYVNKKYLSRFNELILDGEHLWQTFQANNDGIIMDIVAFTEWATSCLNLLDKLSISTNRFVTQFEVWVIGGPDRKMNIGAALGVLKSARKEYECGMAVEYHMSVSSAVFSGLLEEAEYLMKHDYRRAAMVIIGAALEEGLKTRALSIPLEIGDVRGLTSLIHKLKSSSVGLLTEFQAKELEVYVQMRNDAAHGNEFDYKSTQIMEAFDKVQETLNYLLSGS